MPHRLVLYDSLFGLIKGREIYALTTTPVTSMSHIQDGCPEVCHVVELLLKEEWIKIRARQPAITAYTITLKGRMEYQRGKIWYDSLTWWQCVLGRLGLPFYSRGG